ncbi:hypothetical protein RM553_18405 [Zunongwangia sp. F363]|uniref:DUF4188 domain-containing protein n=1 Tax=Autumnicola tepida TaxID=3075595 RepID=A0ABU3CES5_9FLAO|nr:hypothetical protein [Zunongwangia sp. F363]MDT0644819.1 hypothetical protein [Zunongwangia sp. F363]
MRPRLKIPDKIKDTTVFLNSIEANTFVGVVWLWWHLYGIVKYMKKVEGCQRAIPAISGPGRVVMISYWDDEKYLMQFFSSEKHQKYMSFVFRNPEAVTVCNERLIPVTSKSAVG